MRLVELDRLYEQAMRHALDAERIGFIGTAEALRQVASEIAREREELLASNPLELPAEDRARQPVIERGAARRYGANARWSLRPGPIARKRP